MQFCDGLALVMQLDAACARRIGPSLAARSTFGVGCRTESGLRGLELLQLVVGEEIMHGLVVAFAHFDQMLRATRRPWIALLHVIGEIAAMPADVVACLSSASSSSRISLSCFGVNSLPSARFFKPHFLGADLNQDLVQLHVVIDVLLALLARDL